MNDQDTATARQELLALGGARWRGIVGSIPTQGGCTPSDSNDCDPSREDLFVPRWWSWSAAGSGLGSDAWELRDGRADEAGWLRAAYGDRSLVTRVGPRHADHAGSGDRPVGMPTSSATLPGLIVQLLRHAHIPDGADVLDVGTGSGYGCAALAQRLGDRHVTSMDVDEYLTEPPSPSPQTAPATYNAGAGRPRSRSRQNEVPSSQMLKAGNFDIRYCATAG